MNFIDLKSQYRSLEKSIKHRIDCVLEHGQYINGPEVAEMEALLQDYVGVKYCVSVSSGTDALLISLMSLNVGCGDEVITTPFTFAATAEVISLLGARPVFVDIDKSTCNIDAELIEKAITNKTKAIIPVSLYGQPADMNKINEISQKYEIPVIEDAAQSFGATYKNLKSCNLSLIGCTSFFPSKPLGCYGDGGAIFTNDKKIAEICNQIRVHGQSARYNHSRVGLCARMDTLQCAIIIAKLERFSWEIEKRREIARRYDRFFDEINVQRIKIRNDCTSAYAQYTIFVDKRDDFIAYLSGHDIPTAVHYPIPLNKQGAFKAARISANLNTAKFASHHVVSLPMGPYLNELEQSRVMDAVYSYVSTKRKSQVSLGNY